jgi:hypothetical protein
MEIVQKSVERHLRNIDNGKTYCTQNQEPSAVGFRVHEPGSPQQQPSFKYEVYIHEPLIINRLIYQLLLIRNYVSACVNHNPNHHL